MRTGRHTPCPAPHGTCCSLQRGAGASARHTLTRLLVLAVVTHSGPQLPPPGAASSSACRHSNGARRARCSLANNPAGPSSTTPDSTRQGQRQPAAGLSPWHGWHVIPQCHPISPPSGVRPLCTIADHAVLPPAVAKSKCSAGSRALDPGRGRKLLRPGGPASPFLAQELPPWRVPVSRQQAPPNHARAWLRRGGWLGGPGAPLASWA